LAHWRGEESFRSYQGDSDDEKKMCKAIDHYLHGFSCEGNEAKPLKVIVVDDSRKQLSYGWEMFVVCKENNLCIRCSKCNESIADTTNIKTRESGKMSRHAVQCKNTPLLKGVVADALGEEGDDLELDINSLGQEELKKRIIAMWQYCEDGNTIYQYFYVRSMIVKYCKYGKKERMELTQLIYHKESGYVGKRHDGNFTAKIRLISEWELPEKSGPLCKWTKK
jgi:hypothetical protein